MGFVNDRIHCRNITILSFHHPARLAAGEFGGILPALMSQPKKILFLDKVLTKPLKEKRLRGVEVFNVFFIKDLIHLGHKVTLIVHPTWKEMIDREIPPGDNLNLLIASRIGGKNLGSLAALWRVRKQKFDTLFLANVGNGILVAYKFIQLFKMAEKTTLLAHKVPGEFFVKSLSRDTTVVSVNGTISKPFELANFPVTDVYYGILNSDQFYPRDEPRTDEKIRFGMLGDLDSDWKGSDTAIEAFLKLPPEIAEKCELHLAAFSQKNPEIEDSRIVIHKWIDRDEVGDYLRNLDVMLTLSREIEGNMMETFCQTMVQGMLCGLPQITTDLEIFTEKLDEGGGIVTRDLDELVNALKTFATDSDTKTEQGKIAARIGGERYQWTSDFFISKYL